MDEKGVKASQDKETKIQDKKYSNTKSGRKTYEKPIKGTPKENLKIPK